MILVRAGSAESLRVTFTTRTDPDTITAVEFALWPDTSTPDTWAAGTVDGSTSDGAVPPTWTVTASTPVIGADGFNPSPEHWWLFRRVTSPGRAPIDVDDIVLVSPSDGTTPVVTVGTGVIDGGDADDWLEAP